MWFSCLNNIKLNVWGNFTLFNGFESVFAAIKHSNVF